MTTVDTLANRQASHKLERKIGVSICPFASMIVMHRDAERCPRRCPFVAERDRSGGLVRLDSAPRRDGVAGTVEEVAGGFAAGPPRVVGRLRRVTAGDGARISRAGPAGLPFVKVKAVKPVKGVR